jgi:hypothetical protein
VLTDDALEALGDDVERLIPGDPLEQAFTLRSNAPLGIEDAVRAIHTLRVPRGFAADGTPSHGMLWIARHTDNSTVANPG